jgi:putative transposase
MTWSSARVRCRRRFGNFGASVWRLPGDTRQYLSVRYSERLAENAIIASVESTGDSFDIALAESFNGLYKWQLIHRQGPWRGLDDVEFATMTYVDWFRHRRLSGEITADASYGTPADFGSRHHRHRPPAIEAVTQQPESSHESRGGSCRRLWLSGPSRTDPHRRAGWQE